MAAKRITTVFQFRRAKTAEWLANKNVIPAAGEPCFDLELHTLRIGDGVLTYENLPVVGGVDIKIEADGKSIVVEDDVFKLMGYEAAEIGAQPQKTADGIKWVVPVDLTGAVSELQNEVTAIKEDVSGLKESSASILGRITGLETKMDGTGEGTVDAKIDAKIEAFASRITEDEKVNTLLELIEYVNTHGEEAANMAADIIKLEGLVGLTPVKDQIQEAVAGKVDKVEGMGLSSNDFTDSLLGKLQAIEENAQVNIIEKIDIGGSVLDVVDKIVSIPVANVEKAGVVKSATGANMVSVANDGTMSVKKISLRSVFVPVDEEIVLDGGSADKSSSVPSVRIGDMGCNDISDAVAYAEYGDVVTIQDDINMGTGDNDHLVVNVENVTIDLGDKSLVANGSNGAIKVEGGVTILNGKGVVESTLGSDKYSMAVWCENGTVVINDGTYRNATDNSTRGTDLIYASNTGCIEINGGVFEAAKPEWTLNVKDADYKAGTAKIVVKGGKFKGFNPANNSAEGAGTNFVAEGYKAVLEGEYYVVKPM